MVSSGVWDHETEAVRFGTSQENTGGSSNCLQNEADPGLDSHSATELPCELGQVAR